MFDEYVLKCPICGHKFDGDSFDLDGLYCPNCGRWVIPKVVERLMW